MLRALHFCPDPRMTNLYDRWLKYVFDRPETSSGWYFDLDVEPFAATNAELTTLFAATCNRAGTDLTAFNDRQVNEGLNYLFNNACSEVPFALKDASVATGARFDAIRSIGMLYAECFAKRCTQTLSHLNEPSSCPINNICYMLWDVSPLTYWEGNPEGPAFHAAILELLESTLMSRHTACVESALHGLGHMQLYQPEQVDRIVSKWLSSGLSAVPSSLVPYARAARIGHVQ